MNHIKSTIAAIGLCASLAACGGAPGSGSAVNINDIVAGATDACRQGAPLLQLASSIPGVPVEVTIIAMAVRGVCDPLLSGQVPTTLDANTINWLAQNLGGLAKLLGRSAQR